MPTSNQLTSQIGGGWLGEAAAGWDEAAAGWGRGGGWLGARRRLSV